MSAATPAPHAARTAAPHEHGARPVPLGPARPAGRSARPSPLPERVRGPIAPRGFDAPRVLLVMFAVLAVVAVSALVTAVAFARQARDALGFGFAGVPATLPEAGAIFLHNARLMGTVAAAVVIVQALRLGREDRSLGSGGELARTVVDLALGMAVVVNAAIVGAAIGAYGLRMVTATFPHGPIELNAFAFALALYLRARLEPLRAAAAVPLVALALGLLGLAALVEAFV